MAADRAKLCIEMHWEFLGGLSIGANSDALTLPLVTNPFIGDSCAILPRFSRYFNEQAVRATWQRAVTDLRCLELRQSKATT